MCSDIESQLCTVLFSMYNIYSVSVTVKISLYTQQTKMPYDIHITIHGHISYTLQVHVTCP